MKEFKIPMIDQSFFLYIGEDDYYKWAEKVKKELPKYPVDDNCTGLTGGFSTDHLIWLGNSHDKNLIYHELAHYFHYLFEHIGINAENEFKAYITAWIYCEVFEYINKFKEPK
jgi:hypothetical protein